MPKTNEIDWFKAYVQDPYKNYVQDPLKKLFSSEEAKAYNTQVGRGIKSRIDPDKAKAVSDYFNRPL